MELEFKKNSNQNNKQTMVPKKVLESYLPKGYVSLQCTRNFLEVRGMN